MKHLCRSASATKNELTCQHQQFVHQMPVAQTCSWTTEQFQTAYHAGKLSKPRIQRRFRWSKDAYIKFINFLITMRNGIMPFIVNEKIIDSEKMYFIFDGNNRSNAILDFLLTPLEFKSELIPQQFSEKIRTKLRTVSIDILTKSRYTLTKFCRDYGLEEEYTNSTDKESDENAWDVMVEALADMNFKQITIPICIYSDLTDSEMSEIYESINTGGVKLTRQELLASSSATILFKQSSIYCFEELLKTLNEEYYGDMNENEKLQIDTSSISGSINLFEVLISHQIKLSKMYKFIPEPCKEKDGLDIIFKLYEATEGSFSTATPDMNAFLLKVEQGCVWINKHLVRFFTDRLNNYTAFNTHRKFSGNQCVLLMTYVFNALDHNVEASVIEDVIKRVMLYHLILTTLSKDVKEKHAHNIVIDSIRYEAGGSFMPTQLQKIKLSCNLEYVPTDTDIRKALEIMIAHDISEDVCENKPKRRQLSKAKALALSAFCSTAVPINFLDKKHNNDHIVPYSYKWVDCDIDINRLGNYVLIDERINKARGKKPITDAWVEENNLKYMEYPTESVYNQIAHDGIIHKSAYDTLCTKREKIYVEAIMKLL